MNQSNLLYGIHPIEAMLSKHSEHLLEIHYQLSKSSRQQALIQQCEDLKIPCHQAKSTTLEKMAQTSTHQNIVAKIKPLPLLSEDDLLLQLELSAHPLVVLLDGIQDPQNVGAIFRSVESLGGSAILLSQHHSAKVNATVHKVSAGASLLLPYATLSNTVRALQKFKDKGFWVVGTDLNDAQPLAEVDLKGPTIIVMGAEEKGMRHLTGKHCDFIAKIPQLGQTQSLNVSVATAICMYEAQRQRKWIY